MYPRGPSYDPHHNLGSPPHPYHSPPPISPEDPARKAFEEAAKLRRTGIAAMVVIGVFSLLIALAASLEEDCSGFSCETTLSPEWPLALMFVWVYQVLLFYPLYFYPRKILGHMAQLHSSCEEVRRTVGFWSSEWSRWAYHRAGTESAAGPTAPPHAET